MRFRELIEGRIHKIDPSEINPELSTRYAKLGVTSEFNQELIVVENPSPQQLLNFSKKYGALRGVSSSKGVFIFDAQDVTHKDSVWSEKFIEDFFGAGGDGFIAFSRSSPDGGILLSEPAVKEELERREIFNSSSLIFFAMSYTSSRNSDNVRANSAYNRMVKGLNPAWVNYYGDTSTSDEVINYNEYTEHM